MHGNCAACGVYVSGSYDAVTHFCPPKEAAKILAVEDAVEKLRRERSGLSNVVPPPGPDDE